MIGIITYNIPHRKSQDLVWRLMLYNYKIRLLIIPFIPRKKAKVIYEHRPQNAVDRPWINITTDLRFLDSPMSIPNHVQGLSHILIGGAELLPDEVVEKCQIINSHPGYLPNTKGLDALKWAIFNEQPIGVTTHIISKETDGGLLIDRQIVPVYFEDTFHSLAYRVYEKEIEMLVEAIKLKPKTDIIWKNELSGDQYKPSMRMPWYLEHIMIEKFEILRKNSSSRWESE